MIKTFSLEPRVVDYIPDRLSEGIIYISPRYATASHLCCCGCGLEVVTPLNPAKWQIQVDEGRVSLAPSIGNLSFPCNSHYWIIKNQVLWTKDVPKRLAGMVKERDQAAVLELADGTAPKRAASARPNVFVRFIRWVFGLD